MTAEALPARDCPRHRSAILPRSAPLRTRSNRSGGSNLHPGREALDGVRDDEGRAQRRQLANGTTAAAGRRQRNDRRRGQHYTCRYSTGGVDTDVKAGQRVAERKSVAKGSQPGSRCTGPSESFACWLALTSQSASIKDQVRAAGLRSQSGRRLSAIFTSRFSPASAATRAKPTRRSTRRSSGAWASNAYNCTRSRRAGRPCCARARLRGPPRRRCRARDR